MMVSPDEQRQHWPSHALDRVQELAREGKVKFTPAVQRDTKNLDYPPDEVFDCLCSLQSGNFKTSIRYANSPLWHDVYTVDWRRENGTVDSLYIKLALAKNCLAVVLFSFHRPR